MKYEIIPSLLSVEKKAQHALDMIKKSARSVHIDVMDGIFVDQKAFSVDKVMNLRTGLKKTVHLMVVDPEGEFMEYALWGADTIIFHIEAVKKPALLISKIKNEEVKAGICLSPKTSVEKIKPFLDSIDVVLVMTVEPGKGGQELMLPMLDKIRALRKLKKNLDIEVDGGITLKNIKQVKEAGANRFVVGTEIFGQKDPLKAIELLKKEIS
ncbi:MAG: ribulose-phosphate 3-epimerase [Candidatus Woesearchaeota archaeon]|nr:ribulose-phosphate 3-epimerase [Candidatus Woesearchaeota archaeon]